MNQIIELELLQLLLAYFLILLLLVLVRKKEMKLENEIILATTRMTVQLVLIGYLLHYILENPYLSLIILVFICMEVFAIFNIYGRIKKKVHLPLKRIIALSLFIGTTFSLLYFLVVVVQLRPWYEPRYFITIAGMIIGNSMTGISLGAERLITGMENQQDRIENALMLGATVNRATKDLVQESFQGALLPTINSMMGMGIIFLPGLMTGQILSGLSPVTAIKYQIAIMLGIVGSVALTVFLMIEFGYRTFFNKDQQILYREERSDGRP